MRYRVVSYLIWLLVRLAFRLRIKGMEKVPCSGPVIIAANHVSYLDPLLAGTPIRRKTYYLARHELFRIPVLGTVMRWGNAFPVRRERVGSDSFRRAVDVLRSGDVLVMFPEGTRSETGRLQRGLPGIGLVAALGGASIVPTFVRGSRRALPPGARSIRFVPVTVEYGRPLAVPSVPRGTGRRRIYQETADRVMDEIRKLEEGGDEC